MILHSIAKSIRKQDWSVVFIELLVVIAGLKREQILMHGILLSRAEALLESLQDYSASISR